MTLVERAGCLVVVLAGAAGLAWWLSGDSRGQAAFAPFQGELDRYLARERTLDPVPPAACAGPILVVDRGARGFDAAHWLLPAERRAAAADQVRCLAVVDCRREKGSRFLFGLVTGYGYSCDLFVDTWPDGRRIMNYGIGAPSASRARLPFGLFFVDADRPDGQIADRILEATGGTAPN